MVEVTASYQITERTKERDTVYIALPRIQERWTYLLVKRLFDSFSALIGLIVLAIPMAIIALLIVLDSPGGAIFKQERLGKNGKPFLIYKFRTMHHDAEVNGPKWADKEDKRCTRFGAFLRKTRVQTAPIPDIILAGNFPAVSFLPKELPCSFITAVSSNNQRIQRITRPSCFPCPEKYPAKNAAGQDKQPIHDQDNFRNVHVLQFHPFLHLSLAFLAPYSL